jgi:hypothetical protein
MRKRAGRVGRGCREGQEGVEKGGSARVLWSEEGWEV